jgi:hypothetical protein
LEEVNKKLSEEPTTKLLFQCKDKTYTVNNVDIELKISGYNDLDHRTGEQAGHTSIMVSINNEKEQDTKTQKKWLPNQILRLNFENHYETPYTYYSEWFYDVTEHKEIQAKEDLKPDFFKVTHDDNWITVKWLSYISKKVEIETKIQPDHLMAYLAIPIQEILSVWVNEW